MVTTGAITNRIDRLEARGFVERRSTSDRRKVIVRLTEAGFDKVEEVVQSHLDVERELLDALSPRQQRELASLLRRARTSLGDG